MKRLIAILCTTVFLLVGCGNSSKGNEVDDTSTSAGNNESVEVDKNLLDVTVTLPGSMFEGEDINAKVEEMKLDGVKEATVNEDGSITIKMSKSKHKEMIEEMKTSIIESFEDIKTSGNFTSIKDIKYNDDFTKITLEVVKSDYENGLDAFATFGIGISSMMYSLYNGVENDKIQITIEAKDSETGEVFRTVIYPDDLKTE